MSEVKEIGEGFDVQKLISFVAEKSIARGRFVDYFGKPENFRTNGGDVLDFVLKRQEQVEEIGESSEIPADIKGTSWEKRYLAMLESQQRKRNRSGNHIGQQKTRLRSVSYTRLEEKEKITPEELDRVLQLRKFTKNNGGALYVFYSSEGIFFATPILDSATPEENSQKIMNASEGFFKVEKYDWGTEESPEILKDDGFGAIGNDTISGVSSALE